MGLEKGEGFCGNLEKPPTEQDVKTNGVFLLGGGGVVIFGEGENWIHYRHAGFWAKLCKSSQKER